MSWTVYIVECGDGTLYTGITTDLPRRLQAHAKGTGAKYTRGRGPFCVFYTEIHANKSEALQREAQIKQLDARCKRALTSNAHQRREHSTGEELTKQSGKKNKERELE